MSTRLGTLVALGEGLGPITSTHSGWLTAPGDLTSGSAVPRYTYAVSLFLSHVQTQTHIQRHSYTSIIFSRHKKTVGNSDYFFGLKFIVRETKTPEQK